MCGGDTISARFSRIDVTKETELQLDRRLQRTPSKGLTVLVPQPNERLVQHREEGEPPLNGIHEHLFTPFGELVEHESEQEEVDLFVVSAVAFPQDQADKVM